MTTGDWHNTAAQLPPAEAAVGAELQAHYARVTACHRSGRSAALRAIMAVSSASRARDRAL